MMPRLDYESKSSRHDVILISTFTFRKAHTFGTFSSTQTRPKLMEQMEHKLIENWNRRDLSRKREGINLKIYRKNFHWRIMTEV